MHEASSDGCKVSLSVTYASQMQRHQKLVGAMRLATKSPTHLIGIEEPTPWGLWTSAGVPPALAMESRKKEATEARQEHVEQIDDHPHIGDLAQWTDDLLPANSTCYWELWNTTDMSNGKSGCFIQACGNGFHVGLNPVKSQLMSCYRIPQWPFNAWKNKLSFFSPTSLLIHGLIPQCSGPRLKYS